MIVLMSDAESKAFCAGGDVKSKDGYKPSLSNCNLIHNSKILLPRQGHKIQMKLQNPCASLNKSMRSIIYSER